MFINFTNHPSAQWSAEQKAAAQAYGEVIDLAFPAIDPAADEAALDSLASAYAARILHMNPDAVLCQGEFTFVYRVVLRLEAERFRVYPVPTVWFAVLKRNFLPTAAFIIGESAFVLFYADLLHYSKVNIFQPSGSSFFRWVVIYLVYDPRKGAEINVRPHDMPFHILSPQGDDNPLRCQNSLFIYNCNLSPQGDDNPLRCQNSLFIYNCNLSPQGDDN